MYTGIDVHNEGENPSIGVSDSTQKYQHGAGVIRFILLPQRLTSAILASLNPSIIRMLCGCFER